MKMASNITVLVLTFNEAPNIQRTLKQLSWARDILIVDSFSTDDTLNIVQSFPRVRVVQRRFDTHSTQWNFGLDQCESTWVLALDADYVLDPALVQQLEAFAPQSEMAAYFARFRYCIAGRTLRAALYPPRPVLFRKDICRYEQDGHTQRLRIGGNTGWLRGHIIHDDRKPLARWLESQRKYASLEADKLLRAPANSLSRSDRLRLMMWPSVPAIFAGTLLWKRCILDGWRGWYYVLQRTHAELLLSLELLDRRLAHKGPVPSAGHGSMLQTAPIGRAWPE